MTVCRKKIGPISGMSPRTGMAIRVEARRRVQRRRVRREHLGEHEAGQPDDQHVEHDAHDDLVDQVGDREEPEDRGDQHARDHRGDQARPGGVETPSRPVRPEGAGQELAVDRDVDHAGALAEHAPERAEDQGHGERQRSGEQADDRHGAAGGRPGEEADHPGHGEQRSPATAGCRAGVGRGRSTTRRRARRATARTQAVAVDGTVTVGSCTKSVCAARRNVVSPDSGNSATMSSRPRVSDGEEDRRLPVDDLRDAGQGGSRRGGRWPSPVEVLTSPPWRAAGRWS